MDSILRCRLGSLPVPSVVESDITVTSASGVLANQVADHTMALLTGLLRDLPTFFRAQQKQEFIRRPLRDLHGRVGIIGLGRNGRRLAEVLSAFRTASSPPIGSPSTSRPTLPSCCRPMPSTISCRESIS